MMFDPNTPKMLTKLKPHTISHSTGNTQTGEGIWIKLETNMCPHKIVYQCTALDAEHWFEPEMCLGLAQVANQYSQKSLQLEVYKLIKQT